MEVPLNNTSIEELYNFPESGRKEKELVFVICSIQQKENDQLLLELADLKYRIGNVIVDKKNKLKVGDYIMANEFTYNFGKKIEIKIENFKIVENESYQYIKIPVEKYNNTNSKYVDKYLIYRKNKQDFIGFNDEVLNLGNQKINTKINFKDSNVYFFERLLKINSKEFKYNEKISFISEITGEKMNGDFSQLYNNIPYCFKGKIIEINNNNNKILLVSSEIENKFISLDVSKIKTKYLEEGQTIIITAVKYDSIEENVLKFISTEFTKIAISEGQKFEDQKVYLKFNCFGNLKDIKIAKIIINLPNKKFEELIINKTIQYYMYECKNSDFDFIYFPQKVTLVYNNGFSRLFKFFVYKGSLNEANVDITKIEAGAYEFLYYSHDKKFLPKNIELKEIGKFDNFQTFGNKTRKKITFINIPIQNKEDIGHGNSFLVIKLCGENKEKLYGTFKLNSIEFKQLKEYDFNSSIDDFLKDIHKDLIDFINFKISYESIKSKYFEINPIQREYIKAELNQNFREYRIKEERHTFDYFNSIVIWNIFNYFIEMESNISSMEQYINIYDKLEKKQLTYVEKSKILISIFYRLRESQSTLSVAEIFFQDELQKGNPYKIAYDFQFSFIDAITESSGLFQPFLLLDSYFMDLICYNNLGVTGDEKKGVISAYSISMLPLECIKNHLKKTIKPYYLVLRRGIEDDRKYYASVHEYNGVITYNEKILLAETMFAKIDNLDPLPMKKNFAFELFLENIHENFSHNKESILNTKDSPTLYFDREFKYAFAFDYKRKEIGEAGILLESFICDTPILEEMKKLKYEMGQYLDLNYFIDKDFSKLIKKFIERKEKYDESHNKKENETKDEKEENLLAGYWKFYNKKSNTNQDKKNDENNIETNDNKKEQNHEKENLEEKEEVYFSRYNTVIITAETLDELEAKIEDMKNKKFILPKYSIPKKGINTKY